MAGNYMHNHGDAIRTIKDLDECIVEIAAALGCDPDNEVILERISALQAALKPFAELAQHIEQEHPGWYHKHFMFTDPHIKMPWLIEARRAYGQDEDKA